MVETKTTETALEWYERLEKDLAEIRARIQKTQSRQRKFRRVVNVLLEKLWKSSRR